MNLSESARAILGGFILTIDGPAGSGKSTTAERLSAKLGLTYLDTGAMYRAVALAVLERNIDPENEEAVSAVASSLNLEMRTVNGKPSLFIDGRNVDAEIRTPGVSRFVSPVSRYEGVRKEMVRLQRRIGERGGIVAEGRDTGTVVFPQANVRVFLVADMEARVSRRREQLRSMGIEQDASEIRENIRSRDEMDSSRIESPLLKPAGALVVDTSHLTIEAQVDLIEAEVIREVGRMESLAVSKGERNPFAAMSGYYGISRWLVRAFFRVVFGLRVFGSEHLRCRENYIFASNHCSYSDPLVVGCALDREVWFLAKKELFRNRAFASLIRIYHAIPVDREEMERSTMKRILALLGAGRSILMFPEGTRSRTEELRDLKPGLGFTALKSGVAIVPVYVSGTSRLLHCLSRRRRLSVRIGPPIRVGVDCAAGDRRDAYRVLTGMVRSAIGMLKDETEN
ncbi:MAG: (d)CMP kinase [Candidatus Krumholzibacteria bacterium]|nr:(d)CMP kinase [Candidatus Krumholzibacteria bacterium]